MLITCYRALYSGNLSNLLINSMLYIITSLFFFSCLLMNNINSFIFIAASAADVPPLLVYRALAPSEFQFYSFSNEFKKKQWLQGFSGPRLWNAHKCFVQLVIWWGTAEKQTHLNWTVRTWANPHTIQNPLWCTSFCVSKAVFEKPRASMVIKWLMSIP